MEKMSKNTCGYTEKAPDCKMKDLEIWVRGIRKQGDLSRKTAEAVDLALTLWYAMSDEQRADLANRESIRYSIQNLIGHGFSWCV